MAKIGMFAVILGLVHCKAVFNANLSNSDLEGFPHKHACTEEPEEGASFPEDPALNAIIPRLGEGNEFSLRQAAQQELNDYLLMKNQGGRARYLIKLAIKAATNIEIKERLKQALKVCEHASRSLVESCAARDAKMAGQKPKLDFSMKREKLIKDRVVIEFKMHSYKGNVVNAFSLQGETCKDAAEKTLAHYDLINEAIRDSFGENLGTFKVYIAPTEKALVQPDNCCRRDDKVILKLPEDEASTFGLTTFPYFPVMLVDRLQRSTRGFEALCDQKDGQAYIADRAKNEYFGYVVKDKNIEPNEDPVIFEGFMNEPYDGSNLALTRGRENIEPVGEQSEDDRLWLTCVNKHFSVQIYRSDRNFGEP